MPTGTTSYLLGRLATITAPGVTQANVVNVTGTVEGNQIDVTAFGDTARKFQVGLFDGTFEVEVTSHTATIGAQGTVTIGSFSQNCALVNISASASLSDRASYTLTYKPCLANTTGGA
jgi:hypothetical protein